MEVESLERYSLSNLGLSILDLQGSNVFVNFFDFVLLIITSTFLFNSNDHTNENIEPCTVC